ncbi:hypothetical protein D4R42_03670 [bacterium]|nr:MAG: hypothetical protein D4R42_03670 [bacterium]
MKLTKKQEEIAKERLTKFFSKTCEVCSGNEWILSDRFFELREFAGGNLTLGGKSTTLPVIAITCKSCGNVYFFSAILLKLIEK